MMRRPALAALISGLLIASAAGAGGTRAALRIDGAWIRTPPPGAPTAAGYAVIENLSSRPDRLVGAQTKAASTASPHVSSMVGGVMRMREAPGGLPVPAHGSLTLAAGGDHLMLMGLNHPLRPGERVTITLSFAKAGKVAATFEVRDGPAMRGMGGHRM
ncbi:MAG TPA: copper chaperone PCu(A)C [Caulobacteraceae bacterium]|jgi:hypothetical protein|nr:copper chaperone PCu(A)C [Caulobacteraceae bacterium]